MVMESLLTFFPWKVGTVATSVSYRKSSIWLMESYGKVVEQ